MRFFISRDVRKNPFLRSILYWTLAFSLIFWVTNWLFYARITLSYEGIVTHYRGAEESFRPPKSFFSLLEETHFHSFAMMIFLMTWTHLLMFTPIGSAPKKFLIHGTFLTAALDMASGWLIRYHAPFWAWIKIMAFFVFQILILWVMVLVARYLRAEYRETISAPSRLDYP